MKLPVVAVYDANILYPAPLRDLFVRIAQAGLVRAKWTEEIHDEWIRNVLADRNDIPPTRLQRTRTLMDAAVRDCLVTGHRDLIASLTLPDPDDRHVLAAAIVSGAKRIVTFNLKDFPPATLKQYRVEATHPDKFLSSILELEPAVVSESIERQRAALQNPRRSLSELLDTFERNGLPTFVERLRPSIRESR
jgi:predicted nucleic acid-binding protein